MRVRCVSNRVDRLPSAYLWPFPDSLPDRELPIKIGSVYAVQSIEIFRSGIWYYVEDEDYVYHEYPMWYPAKCFQVEDGTIPSDWIAAHLVEASGEAESLTLGFSEWVRQRDFYDALVSADEAARQCYKLRRQ
jgi:hypothetical protein